MTTPTVLVGTRDGLRVLGEAETNQAGHRVNALATDAGRVWTITDHHVVSVDSASVQIPDLRAHCLLPTADGVLVGAAEATMMVVSLSGTSLVLEGPDPEFASAPGREAWYTPWGGPPDVRSLARDADGTLYANVHVGGVLRLRDGGTWEATLDIDADVHEVVAHPDRPGVVLAATARGLALSTDGASSWDFVDDGLHAAYSRAVAVSGDTVYLSASTGPGGARAAVYRAEAPGRPFRRCEAGLPEWFTTNVNTACLAADGESVFAGDAVGRVYRSDDRGITWEAVADDLPGVECLALS